ncbi:Lipoyl synthase [uncultured archaeon]|nr:Lipoyl synthase [uncultured archaeon]
MSKPGWLKTKPPAGTKFHALNEALREYGLNTVCTGSFCPNRGECWSRGVAAFMIMGSICTRNCRFCGVKKGRCGEQIDPSEPSRLAEAVEKLNLEYVALTSVDRDDLPDGGAGHFADCIKAIKSLNKNVVLEVLIPDFQGDTQCLQKIIEAHPDIVGHNIETTREFQAIARDRRAGYGLSLDVLRNVKKISSSTFTKSSLMLGFGETDEMVFRAMDDLRNARVDFLTLGQYLSPSGRHLEVKEFVQPEKFAFYKKKAEDKGFLLVFSGPFVRSSYVAEGIYSFIRP